MNFESMRISAMGGESIAIDANGQITSVTESLFSHCGTDFDEYMRRALAEAFPYNPHTSAMRKLNDLWKHRRLRLYSNQNDFREGKVVSWTQYNMGPFDRITHWSIDIEMDTLGVNDTVIVNGLKAAKEHNGKRGRIVKLLKEKGRFKVKLSDKTTVAIKPVNLKTTATTYDINRMNIEGGGTLTIQGSVSTQPLISLEWLEPAFPQIDLNEGALKANCPVCRAVEPPLAAYDDAPTETQDECPICLETKMCRTLQCNHEVCTDCWSKWRNSTSSIPVPPPQMDPDKVEKERRINTEEMRGLLPHTRGGTGTSVGDDEEAVEAALVRSSEAVQNILSDLLEAADSGEEGLRHFWLLLKTCATQHFVPDAIISLFADRLTIPALEILILVIEERADEIVLCLRSFERDFPEEVHTTRIDFMTLVWCNRIGELYEEVNNYRGAIPWYERAVLLSQKNAKAVTREDMVILFKRTLATQYCNLGLAQKHAALFKEALINYDASMQIQTDDDVVENRKMLLREMKEWTGTSGKLTPGC